MFKNKLIWIFGMPRSGTSWLGQIFDSSPDVIYRLAPLFSYTYKDYVEIDSPKSLYDEFHQKVFIKGDAFTDQVDRRKSGEYPIFIKKKSTLNTLVIKETRYHNLVESLINYYPKIKIIYIVRNPCAAINSWLKTPNEFPITDDLNLYWRNGKNRKTGPEEFWGFDDWISLTSKYENLIKEHSENVSILKYEDLVNNPIEETKRLFDFAGLKITKQTLDFLKDSQFNQNESDYAVYKDPEIVLNKWKKQLPSFIKDEIFNSLKNNQLTKYLNY